MQNYALLTEYDGTSFHGWQSQKGLRNVQDEIRNAIFRCTGETVKLYGCSRTDAGVHALGHVSNFHSDLKIPVEKLPVALNSHLPDDISIQNAAIVPDDFHARFHTVGKTYRYRIISSTSRSALERSRAYYTPYLLDQTAMRQAAAYFEGTHDFSGFMASGGETRTTVRTLFAVNIEERAAGIELVLRGDGFLYNMVRIIAGTLYYVGIGKIPVEEIPGIIASCDRRNAGKTLPAHGLYLEKVFYEIPVFDAVL